MYAQLFISVVLEGFVRSQSDTISKKFKTWILKGYLFANQSPNFRATRYSMQRRWWNLKYWNNYFVNNAKFAENSYKSQFLTVSMAGHICLTRFVVLHIPGKFHREVHGNFGSETHTSWYVETDPTFCMHLVFEVHGAWKLAKSYCRRYESVYSLHSLLLLSCSNSTNCKYHSSFFWETLIGE